MDHPEARDHDTDGISVIFPSVGPWTGTGNHLVEINTHGGNQDRGSRHIKPRIFASNGGFFA